MKPRVFVIGRTRDEVATLRARAAGIAALEIVGAALARDIDERRIIIPAAVDFVLTSRELLAPRSNTVASNARAASSQPDLVHEELTPRERDVLALVADGHGNRVIAERLGVSEHTVKFHLTSIFAKLGASTRTEAVRKGLHLGLIDL